MKNVISTAVALTFSTLVGLSLVMNTYAEGERKPACDCKDKACKCQMIDNKCTSAVKH